MKKLKKYAVITRVSLSNAVAYRASVLPRFCFYTLFIYVFMSLWRAIYQQDSVHGYDYTQIVWYLMMTEFIAFTGGTNIFSTMNDEVKSGAIVYQIGRPTHYVFYQLANSTGQMLLSFVSFGALAVTLGFIFVGPLATFSPAGLPLLLVSIALGILLNFFMLMLIGLASFVLEDNFALYLIYQKLGFMLGMFLPVEFLPYWLQPVAKNLPFSYVYWAPAKIFVSFSPELCLELIPRQLMWVSCAVVVTLLCYHLCARRLQINGG